MLETNNKATCIYKFCNLHQVTACFESYCIVFCVKLQRNMNEVTNQGIYHWTTISVSLLSSICSIVSIPKLGQSIRIIQVVCLMQWSSHSMANGYHSRINENNPRLRSNALESRKRMDRKDIEQELPTNVHTLIFQHTADGLLRVDKALLITAQRTCIYNGCYIFSLFRAMYLAIQDG